MTINVVIKNNGSAPDQAVEVYTVDNDLSVAAEPPIRRLHATLMNGEQCDAVMWQGRDLKLVEVKV